MDVTYWRFLDETHPLYDRPADATRWEFATRGLVPEPYRTPSDTETVQLPSGQPYPQEEPLHMAVTGLPALDWYQNASGHTVLTMRLHSEFVADMDLSAVVTAARAMFEDFKRLSEGPLTYTDLRKLNHPYGYGAPDEPSSWAKLRRPRKVPRYAVVERRGRVSVGHIRGIRGSVPTLAVVNRQTGEFYRSWRWTYSVRGDGLTLTFWNERRSERGAPVAWFLAHGTRYMQAHGPWEVVPRRHWPLIVNAWRRAAREAAQRRRLAEGLYGREEDV